MLKVKDVMSTEIITLKPEDTLKTARGIMHLARIRHVPIVDHEKRFCGLITHRDILLATVSKLAGIDRETQQEIDAGIPIKEVMRKDAQWISEETDITRAAEILLKNKYGCLPVVRKEHLVGIITEADFIMLAIQLLNTREPDQQTASA
ncbi:CBS domain-containing protein [Desulfoplanes formicivorans]|uniref:Membrane protein n=1 Tax=Desulfoplanes formicivorans TaxID=1592317 RepID=A0A194AF76_9BACT|nr:CBS domain-containing protein [Desulfoplanes formicivorans]GAU07850.1 membrane protein [Desulfoplanes formicivorans]